MPSARAPTKLVTTSGCKHLADATFGESAGIDVIHGADVVVSSWNMIFAVVNVRTGNSIWLDGFESQVSMLPLTVYFRNFVYQASD